MDLEKAGVIFVAGLLTYVFSACSLLLIPQNLLAMVVIVSCFIIFFMSLQHHFLVYLLLNVYFGHYFNRLHNFILNFLKLIMFSDIYASLSATLL